MASSLTVKRDGKVLIATLNRPAKLNAASKEVFEELFRVVEVLETDKSVRVLVITGSGNKAFCIGTDLKERQGMNEKDVLVRLEFVRDLFTRMEGLPIPVIAAINGVAQGSGLELALACDLRVAAENAMLWLPDVALAAIPAFGGTQRLSRLVGLGKALELILLAKRLSAEEAAALGLVNEVSGEEQALEVALKWAKQILEMGPIALAQAKGAIRKGLEQSLSDGLKMENEAFKPCLYSKDHLEGLKSFTEKRKPNFVGA